MNGLHQDLTRKEAGCAERSQKKPLLMREKNEERRREKEGETGQREETRRGEQGGRLEGG